jgi:hypothetical protein
MPTKVSPPEQTPSDSSKIDRFHQSIDGNEQTQPWKKIVEDIVGENEANPLEKDFFMCQGGFASHTLAA